MRRPAAATLGTAFLVLLGLKLAGTLAWSWWWITAPLWVPLCLIAAWALVVVLTLGLVRLTEPNRT